VNKKITRRPVIGAASLVIANAAAPANAQMPNETERDETQPEPEKSFETTLEYSGSVSWDPADIVIEEGGESAIRACY
jgi:hypothetical protein